MNDMKSGPPSEIPVEVLGTMIQGAMSKLHEIGADANAARTEQLRLQLDAQRRNVERQVDRGRRRDQHEFVITLAAMVIAAGLGGIALLAGQWQIAQNILFGALAFVGGFGTGYAARSRGRPQQQNLEQP
jgi:hypothetical protein